MIWVAIVPVIIFVLMVVGSVMRLSETADDYECEHGGIGDGIPPATTFQGSLRVYTFEDWARELGADPDVAVNGEPVNILYRKSQ